MLVLETMGYKKAVIAITLLAGCAPIPHKERLLPDIDLAFRSDRPDSAWVRVGRRSRFGDCADPLRTVSVRSGDTVHIPGLVEWSYWVLLLPHDPITGFEVCFEQAGNRYLGVHDMHFGLNTRKRVALDCLLAAGAIPLPDTGLPVSRPAPLCSLQAVER